MTIAGIDIGTTGCKCTIYSTDGLLISEAYQEYDKLGVNEHMIDANMVWDKVKKVIKKAAKNVDSIAAIGVTSFGESAVLLDKNGQALMPSLLYTSPLGKEQCDRLVKHFGEDYITKSTGLIPNSMYSIAKLMWVKENHPDVFNKCESICLFEDYIVYKLSDIKQIDYSLATRTMVFDINKLYWNEEILEYAGIPVKLFSKPVPTGTKAGYIRSELSKEFGISNDTVIVSACHDQIAAAIGTGVYKQGMAVDGTGTVECITPVFNKNVDFEKLYEGKYAIVPYINDLYVTYAFSFTGGALLKWYRDKIAYHEAKEISATGKSPYEHFNEQVNDLKPSGLLILPHFAGAATPYMDNESKGAIVGLTLETTSIDIYQGLMEGVTYEMLVNMEKLAEAGISIDHLRATGGGATSKLWLQMKADILNIPIVSLGEAQSGTLGCIMLAGLACGKYKSLEEAEKVFVKVKDIYYPNQEKHKIYNKIYQRYKKLYHTLIPLREV